MYYYHQNLKIDVNLDGDVEQYAAKSQFPKHCTLDFLVILYISS